jgi:hypothetical protein
MSDASCGFGPNSTLWLTLLTHPVVLSFQEHLTEQELEELEACEEWVALQASMEELEQDHLVAIALR